MKMQDHWYLGLIGGIGIYNLPAVAGVLQGTGSWWGLSNLAWFLWFLYFIPEKAACAKTER